MSPSFFVRLLPRSPPRFFPGQVADRPRLRNQKDHAPGPHVVDLASLRLGERPLPPRSALGAGASSPTNLQCYLGRIEEPDGEDGHLVRLFERPSGTELLTTLRREEHLRGEPAPVGTLLRVWTWTEHDAQGRGTDRLYVEILPPGPRLEAIRQELREWTDLDWGTGDDGT